MAAPSARNAPRRQEAPPVTQPQSSGPGPSLLKSGRNHREHNTQRLQKTHLRPPEVQPESSASGGPPVARLTFLQHSLRWKLVVWHRGSLVTSGSKVWALWCCAGRRWHVLPSRSIPCGRRDHFEPSVLLTWVAPAPLTGAQGYLERLNATALNQAYPCLAVVVRSARSVTGW